MHELHLGAVVVGERVRGVQPLERVEEEWNDDPRWAMVAVLPQERRERAALDVLHRDVVDAVLRPEIHDGDDVGVVQPRRDAHLVEEHVDERLVVREVRVQHLDGVEALEAGLAGMRDPGTRSPFRRARACR